MAQSKIKLGFKEKSVPQRITFGRTIAAGILNSDLADKAALAARVTTATDDLAVKEGDLGLALRQVPTMSDLRDVSRDRFDGEMDAVSTVIETQTDFNAPIMTGIGFELASDSRVVIPMTKIENVHLSAGDEPGEVHGTWNPVKGNRTYMRRHFEGENLPASEDLWVLGMAGSKSNCDLRGLTSGARVWVQFCATGAGEDNQGPWSDPVFVTVP